MNTQKMQLLYSCIICDRTSFSSRQSSSNFISYNRMIVGDYIIFKAFILYLLISSLILMDKVLLQADCFQSVPIIGLHQVI